MKVNGFITALFAAVSCASTAFASPIAIAPRTAGVRSVSITANQNLFDTVSQVVVPVATHLGRKVQIPNQSTSFSLGGSFIPIPVTVEARDIRLDSFDIGSFDMRLDQDNVRYRVNDVSIQVNTRVQESRFGGGTNIGVSLRVNTEGRVIIRNNGNGGLSASVEGVSVSITSFDFSTGGFLDFAVDAIESLFRNQIRSAIESRIAQPVDDAITGVLNKALQTPLIAGGSMEGINFQFAGAFLGDPVVNADGLTVDVSVVGSTN
ncbi:hypothetical protein HK102_005214 [Quaeritorhiza haematococci]|nr:hypothetical protein HK102_005214 [Quaeritorhiza haematococci]